MLTDEGSLKTWQFGRWRVSCSPQDGARLTELSFDEMAILTSKPTGFDAPKQYYGRYETRPVFGYDDCFPTVNACDYPVPPYHAVPDHGELCWLRWNVSVDGNELRCETESCDLPITFRRSVSFEESSLEWRFDVISKDNRALPFLHTMHPLMPLRNIVGLELPRFEDIVDEASGAVLPMMTPQNVTKHLFELPLGTAQMLLLRGVHENTFTVRFRGGKSLRVSVPPEWFSTLGIWWNNEGYPNEHGLRRTECALEPMATGSCSLEDSYARACFHTVEPRGKANWTIRWEIVNERSSTGMRQS